MIFTSVTYLVFLPIVFVVNWILPARWRNAFLVVASYVFYASWKWQFAFLLLGLSLFNWAYGRWILATAERTWPLVIGIAANLGALVYFKYANFLIANIAAVAQLFGGQWHPSAWDIILPLGISFFTFQGIAYLFDVATGEPPLESLVNFLLFKALWPQLIAGPIIRLSEIRTQIEEHRTIRLSDVSAGAQRILFGLFKKVVIADNLAPYVDMAFNAGRTPSAIDVVAGILGFAMQIYFDFSAYSDIAIGSARLFGFTFPENFAWPYAARSPQEFWNRWHMTLSRWIRDYLYTPLSFSTRNRPALAPLWLLVAMAICGLWHGAQWTFVLWGLWHGVLLVAGAFLTRVTRASRGGLASRSIGSLMGWVATLTGVCLGWLMFRAASVTQALAMLRSMASARGGGHALILRDIDVVMIAGIFALLVGAQIARRMWTLLPPTLVRRGMPLLVTGRMLAYAAMIMLILVFNQGAQSFVYFDF